MSQFTLYELKDRYLELLEYMEEQDLDPQLFEDTLSMLEDDLETKVDNVIKIIKSIEGETKIIEEEKKRLEARISTRKNKVERLKRYLEDNLLETKDRKVKTPLFSAWIQKNPPSVMIENEKEIGDEYKIAQDPKIDRKLILDKLKTGEMVPGAEIKITESIRIR